jgi:mono/diheme cytochrome c family protein
MVNSRRIIALVAMVTLAACGGGGPPDPVRGAAIFAGQVDLDDANVPTCANCHAIRPGEPANIGTNLSNIGNRAGSTVDTQSAQEYLRTAIVDPDAYLAGGFQEGIMYRRYGDVLTAAQIDDLVAYMLTLQSGIDE